MTYILGISAYYHDSAAVLLDDGEIVAAAQEERFTRKRHDAAFPHRAVRFCLQQAGIALSNIDHIVFYDKPFLKFERLLESHIITAPGGLPAFIKAMPVWLKEKLYLKKLLRDSLCETGNCDVTELPELLFTSHHQAHAASAFYASPFEDAAILCLDGVGEWATTSVWCGEKNKLEPLWQINFPHSLGLLYSAFTYYAGFRVNSGEYKLMGLAPYGEARYVDLIMDNLIDLKPDGTFRLDMSYFNFVSGLTMTSKKFHRLFGDKPRQAESEIRQRDMDIARSIQVVTEEVVLRLAKTIRNETGANNLCLAGGVALNCVANGRLSREKIFENIWVQPAAGDAGGALGAAYIIWYQYLNKQRQTADGKSSDKDRMQGALLGTAYSDTEIETTLRKSDAKYKKYESTDLLQLVAEKLDDERVVGWFQGRMEYGPRALGSRSILGDPRSKTMQTVINLKIKYRESFRPFAPAVLMERLADWFEMTAPSPYMLFVSNLNRDKLLPVEDGSSGLDMLKQQRSLLPAITHVDNTARVQTVSQSSNTMFYQLLRQFEKHTSCPVLINTSFNVRGEPIVESPADALRCFMKTDMDILAIGSFILNKEDQPGDVLLKLEQNCRAEKQLEGSGLKDTGISPPGLTEKELRQFSFSTGVIIAILFGWLIPWFTESPVNEGIIIFSALWIVWGMLVPKTLKPVYKAWMRFGKIMSKVTTPLILSIIYFCMIFPAGLVMRLFGKDPLCRKLDYSAASYRIPGRSEEVENLRKPF